MSIAGEALFDHFSSSKISHLRFIAQNALFASSAIGLAVGGVWIWAPFVIATILINIVDAVCGPDKREDRSPPTAMHSAMLLLSAVLLALNATFFAYHFASGDPLGLVRLLRWFGVDFDAARNATSGFDLFAALIAQGFVYSVAMSTCHELLHRIESPFKMTLSRWISTLVLNPWFLIHHTGLHHRYVGLPRDVDTPRRGMSLYSFVARAWPANTAFAAQFERERLAKRGISFWSVKNRFLTGWGICAAVAGYFFLIGGCRALLAYLVSGALGRLLLNLSGYIQHYGVIRVEGEPIDARLSWDVYCVGTNALLNDIGRHADHHDHPLRPSVALCVSPGAPELHCGYLTLIGMTLIPPLFDRFMKPRLDDWDRNYATDAELAYMRANGIPCAER